MQFKINNTVSELSKELSSIEYMFSEINKIVDSTDLIFSHMNINGVEVYQDHEDYIVDRLKEIDVIEAVLISPREFIDGLLISATTYLEGAIPEISLLTNEYYQGVNENTWSKFEQMIEGIQWVVQMIGTIDQFMEEKELTLELDFKSESLIDVLQTLEGAMKQSDMVLIGDIIKYEIEPLLAAIKAIFNTLIDTEVRRHDLN